jgi:ribosomal protein S8
VEIKNPWVNMKKKNYIEAIQSIFGDASPDNIRVCFKMPTYQNLIRGIEYVSRQGYNNIYFTCFVKKDTFLKSLERKFNITVVDQHDSILKCIELKKYDLLDYIQDGID